MDPAGVGDDFAVDLGGFADHQHIGLDIAFHDTVDLDLAGTGEVADDPEIGRKNGWRGGFLGHGRLSGLFVPVTFGEHICQP